jgi:hypothetical protein
MNTNTVLLYSIPSEIVIYNIIPNIGIEGIVKFSKVTKIFHKHRNKIYSYFIINDRFLNRYIKFFHINLIRTISESSFSYNHFDEIYDFIKYGGKNKFKNKFEIAAKKEQNHINNTFIIFKLLKCSVDSQISKKEVNRIKSTKNTIFCNMLSYFESMYFSRNTSNHSYTSFLKNENTFWERSNINLYNICENINLMYNEKNSDIFENNLLNFNNAIVSNNGYNIVSTSILIENIFNDDSCPIKVSIFAYYTIFKYLNYMFHSKLEKGFINNTKFTNSSIKTLEGYEQSFHSIYKHFVSVSFQKNILQEISLYKQNIENKI